MNSFEISQILGLLAFVSDICSFQFKEKKYILISFAVSSLFLGIHFLLLGNQTAGLLLLFVSLPRFLAASYTHASSVKVFFIMLSLVIGFLTYKEPVNALATIATVVVAFASFRKTDKEVRQVMMCGTSLWLLHNCLIFTPAGIIIEFFFLMSNFVGYFRYYVRGKGSSSPD